MSTECAIFTMKTTYYTIFRRFCVAHRINHRSFYKSSQHLQDVSVVGQQSSVCLQGPCRTLSQQSVTGKRLVLGIETSCDDTGAAVVDNYGNILGEALSNQTEVHLQTGGIIPSVARDLHKEHIASVVNTALSRAGLQLQDVDAIATTVKPGLIISLDVGMKYTKELLNKSSKPFIPIHHMEAHALTARMISNVSFPFLVLLVSGGHCLLAVAKDVDDFYLLGHGLDVAPGDAFDKVARALDLKELEECRGLSGGRAIELLASRGNPKAYSYLPKLHRHFNCHFSFSGIRTFCERLVEQERQQHGLKAGEILPTAADICASFQYFVLRQLANRLQRAVIYCNDTGLLPPQNRTLVVSGGVASNMFLRKGLEKVCDIHNLKLVCPPPKLCTDNGVMIAWNGMEKLLLGRGQMNISDVTIEARCPLGKDISEDVAARNIKVEAIKLLR